MQRQCQRSLSTASQPISTFNHLHNKHRLSNLHDPKSKQCLPRQNPPRSRLCPPSILPSRIPYSWATSGEHPFLYRQMVPTVQSRRATFLPKEDQVGIPSCEERIRNSSALKQSTHPCLCPVIQRLLVGSLACRWCRQRSQHCLCQLPEQILSTGRAHHAEEPSHELSDTISAVAL